jgi:hypothetical protein
LVSGAAARGTETISITNRSAAVIKGKTTIEIFASTAGSIDNGAIQLLKIVKSVNLKPGQKLSASMALSLKGSTLAAGTYALFTRTIDPSGTTSDSTAGPTVTVAAAFVALSERVNKSTLSASAAAGGKSHGSVTLTLVNNGNITTPGTTTVALFATPAGVVDGSSTQLATLTKPLRIKAGKSLKLTVPVKTIPSIAAGAYTVVAQVTDSSHQVTAVTVGPLTVTA